MRVCVHVHIRACLEKTHRPECILLQRGRESRESAQNPRNIQTVRHDSFSAVSQAESLIVEGMTEIRTFPIFPARVFRLAHWRNQRRDSAELVSASR